jgi:F5/8 type C domain-containing protein/dolichyl-phosphate-mannose-protein mannosyltransferase
MPVLLLAGGFAVRLLYLATPELDSDQAIFGLMAMHILRGELSIFQWGYHYMGTLESFVAAPLMLLFGPTRFALNLAPTLFSMLFAYASYHFAREAAGHAIGLWALAFACFPPCFLVWNVVVARGGYSETLALGTLAAYFALRAVNAEDARLQRRCLAAAGFILGLAFWTHLNTMIFCTAIVLFWLIERPSLVWLAPGWVGLPFLLGSLPFWVGSIEARLKTFEIATPPLPPFPVRVWTFLTYRLPVVVGIYFDNTRVTTLPYLAWLIIPIQLAALVVTAKLSRGSCPPRLRRAARLLLLLAVTFPVIYLASPFSGLNTERYLIPLYTVLTLAPALLVHDVGRSRRFPAAILGGTLVALYAIPTIRGAKILNPETLRVYRQERAQEQRLLAELERLGLNAVYVDSYWDAARFTFDASERIFFATPFSDRIHEYLDFVDGAEHPAFLFHYPAHTPAFEGTLKLAGARYQKRIVAGFTLYSAIEAPPGGGPEIPVAAAAASHNTVDAPLAVDHDATTRWEPMTAQQGMWFQVDLGREQEVAEADIWPRFAEAGPPGLRVEVSADGENWTTITEANDYWKFCSWAQNRPLPTLDGWIVVRFKPVRCRWIRLIGLGADNQLYYWTIDELRVRAPAGELLRPSQPPPRVAGHLFADPVLAARWPGAVRHWQGKILPRFDLRDASLVGRVDSIVVPNNDPLAVEHGDQRLGVSFATVTPLGDYAALGGLHLDSDDLERRVPARWQEDPRTDTASIDLGRTVEISGVVVEHREAASSFPRGLVARTSIDGTRWSDPEPLEPRPPELFWSDEGLLGASFRARIFLFPKARPARLLTLSASPRHPKFPWVVRSITALVPHRGPSP